MSCHQIYSCPWTFVWKTLFALLSNTGPSPTPRATSDFISTEVDSYRQPDKCAFPPQGFLQSDGSPSKAWGINTPPGTHSTKGDRGELINVPVLRGTVSAQAPSTRFNYDCPPWELLPAITSAFHTSHSSQPHCCFLPSNLPALTPLFRLAPR